MKGQKVIRWILAGVVISGAGLACTQPAAPPPPPPRVTPTETTYLDHVIRYPGETLALIAAWYTGKATNWTLIESANPGVRADKLRIGQVLRLPEDALVRRDPLPQSFLKRGPERTPQDGTVSVGEVAPPSEGAPTVETPAETAPADSPSSGTALSGTETNTQVVTQPVETTPEEVTPPPPPVEKTPEDLEKEKLLDELLK